MIRRWLTRRPRPVPPHSRHVGTAEADHAAITQHDLEQHMTQPTTITGADWLVVTEALETAGWVGADDNPLEILRKNGAVWAVSNDCGDSQLGAAGWSVAFPSDTPVVVIVAACLAAAGQPAVTAEATRHLGVAPDPS